jgi:transcription antitermination factor NusG
MQVVTAVAENAESELTNLPLVHSGPELHWYAAYTSANHEKKVTAELQRRAVECFLPLYGSVRRWRDRRVRLEMPLFPGYVFVRSSPAQRLCVLQIPGVVRFVSFSSGPARVPEAEIARVQDILRRGFRAAPHPYLTIGRRVRVKAGPLRGLEGILLRRNKKLRFVVSIDLIMRSMAVEMDEGDLEPLPRLESR